jgi:3-oxoadipate enol-lactonase
VTTSPVPAWVANAPPAAATQRPPVVLLHGVGGNKAQWAGQLEHLAREGWRAFAWDMPGYGASAAPDGDYSFEMLAGALGRLLDRHDIGRAILVGHSMGGMVALETWARFPGRIAGLVLACTSARFGSPDGAWQQRFIGERVAPLDAGLGMEGLARRLVPAMMTAAATQDALAAAIGVMSAVPEQTYRRALAALLTFDRRDALPSIAVPVLALAAAEDVQAPPGVMEKMASRIPGAEFAVLPGCGHLANFERPELFDAAIAGFLARRCADG